MAIKTLDLERSQLECFIRLPHEIYRHDTRWIPPLHKDVYDQISAGSPFLQKKGNSFRHFLTLSGNRLLGRITAMVNVDMKDRDTMPAGLLGFFECQEDYNVAADLLNASIAWLRDHHGLRRIWGPMNFDIWHAYRFMTRGFDQKPFYGEPYNKPYYPEFFERYGFSVKQEWDSIEVCGRQNLEGLLPRGEERYRLLVEKGYRFEHLNVGRLVSELRKLQAVLTDSFSGFLGFTPISPEEFVRLYSPCRYALNPRLAIFVYDEEDELAGFALALIDLADAAQAMNDRDDLFSRLRFLARRRHADCVNFYAGGLTQKEMAKNSGLGRAGYAYVIRQIINAGYERMIQSLIIKNGFSHALAGPHRKNIVREYALYEFCL
ncbi:MAG: hypothetical protein AB1715_01850 [Acidobacteriota bacterium]